MRINKINSNYNEPSFKKMNIVNSQSWPVEILDSFVKNKDIQELTKEWAKENKNLSACFIRNSTSGMVSIYKNIEHVCSIYSRIENLQKCVQEFSKNSIKSNNSENLSPKYKEIEKYIDDFNHTIDENQKAEKFNKTTKDVQPEKKRPSFWDLVKLHLFSVKNKN